MILKKVLIRGIDKQML